MGEEKGKIKEYLAGGVFDCLCDDCFTLINSSSKLFEFLGYSKEEIQQLFHNHLLECIYIDDRPALKEEISRQLAAGNVFMYENRLITKGGDIRWIWISAELRTDVQERQYFHCIFHDNTNTKRDQEKLAISEQRYEIVLALTQDIIFELDCQTFDIYYSANFEKKFGYQIPVKGFPDSMFETDIIYEADKSELRKKFHSLLDGQGHMSHEYRIKHRDGHYTWVDIHATVMQDTEGRPIKILGIIADIHKRKTEILETRKIANQDPLTGLLNRRESVRRINRYIESCSNLAALLIIDIDNFKTLNDTKGHPYGDAVLSSLSEGLRAAFRQDDVVARIGGDEFLIFISNLKEHSNVIQKLESIQKILHDSKTASADSAVSCSIGVSFYPEHGSDFTTLFAKADSAMYHAKKYSKGQYCIYKEGEFLFQLPANKFPLNGKNNIQNHIIECLFRIFMEAPDNQAAILSALEFIGRTFRVDRIYIGQKTGSDDFRVSYNWCNSRIPTMLASLDKLSVLEIQVTSPYPAAIYSDIEDIKDVEVQSWFKERGVKAAFLFWLGDKSTVLNMIGLEDCHEARESNEEILDALHIICKILNLFLIREDKTNCLAGKPADSSPFK